MISLEFPLAGCYIKIERAKHHIDTLEKSIMDFLNSNPYDILGEIGPEGYYILRLKINQTIPSEWSAIIGDILHNLRSALDLLACQLIRVPNPEHDCSWVSFIISENHRKFKTSLEKSEFKMQGKSVIEIIKSLKPYKGGEENYWLLHRLNIQDKHRLLVLAYAKLPKIQTRYITPKGLSRGWVIERAKIEWPYIVNDGLIIDAIRIDHVHPNMNLEVNLPLEIVLNEPGIIQGERVIETLNNFVTIVENSVNQFAPLFNRPKRIRRK